MDTKVNNMFVGGGAVGSAEVPNLSAQKHDGLDGVGPLKSRLDLFPWDSVQVGDSYYPIATAADALSAWWYIKPRDPEFSVPRRMLNEVGKVLAYGANKYAARGWEKGIKFSRLFAAAMRHADANLRGEVNDPESGLPHEAHFYCNLAFIGALATRHGALYDDRPEPNRDLLQKYDQRTSFVRDLASAFSGAVKPAPAPTGTEN